MRNETWDVLKLNELPRAQQILVPHKWGTYSTKQETGTAASISVVFHCHLHATCEGHYLGQDWFEGNNGHLPGKRRSLPKSQRQEIDITFNFLRF